MAAPTLADWQFWFNELTIGLDTEYDLVEISNLFGVRISDGDKAFPRAHGAIPGDHFKRPLDIDLQIDIAPASDVWSKVFTFDTAFAVSEDISIQEELHFKFPGIQQLFARARVSRKNTSLDGFSFNLVPREISLKAADPRLYSATLHSETIKVFDPDSGIDFPIVEFPIDWPVAAGGDVIVNNAGNARAYPRVRFFGPTVGTITEVELTNRTTGKVLDINRAILSSQTLIADMDRLIRGEAGNIIEIAGASAYNDWQLPRAADPFYLEPGDNVLRYTLTGTSTDARLTIDWRDTYI